MLGKSGFALREARMMIVALAALAACAHNVPQDTASGADAKQKGAKELHFENGEAREKGIVTYPGGDRTDWKLIEIPEKKTGTLELKLSWKAPRPKLQLAFDVFDEWNGEIVSSKKTNKKRSKGSTKSATISNAKGKYFVRVFAVGRGDAGAYTLTAEFIEAQTGPAFDIFALEVP
ncbi:MAG: hypothetical protein NT062_20840, partial [Proteobacteria bacterium]|nr:hypothetical protein [Pseudomonadota bacterium]